MLRAARNFSFRRVRSAGNSTFLEWYAQSQLWQTLSSEWIKPQPRPLQFLSPKVFTGVVGQYISQPALLSNREREILMPLAEGPKRLDSLRHPQERRDSNQLTACFPGNRLPFQRIALLTSRFQRHARGELRGAPGSDFIEVFHCLPQGPAAFGIRFALPSRRRRSLYVSRDGFACWEAWRREANRDVLKTVQGRSHGNQPRSCK